jgi:hypothetical protein
VAIVSETIWFGASPRCKLLFQLVGGRVKGGESRRSEPLKRFSTSGIERFRGEALPTTADRFLLPEGCEFTGCAVGQRTMRSRVVEVLPPPGQLVLGISEGKQEFYI